MSAGVDVCKPPVSAQRCGAVQGAWEKTILVQHNDVFIKENALAEQRGASRLSISFQVKFNGSIVTPKALHTSLAAMGAAPL